MVRVKQSPIEKRCKLLYVSLKRRIEEKKNKNGRIIRHGRPVPFVYEQLLEWMVVKFTIVGWQSYTEKLAAASVNRIQCRYCRQLITATTCAYDHEIPLKRGGGVGLDNLDVICRDCNNFKGGLTPVEFITFRKWLAVSLSDAARADIEGRLKKAVQLAASVSWARKKKLPQ